MKEDNAPDCFGNQARGALCGEPPDECLACEVFEKCHKYTVTATLHAISENLDLIVQNGLVDGRLKGIEELDEIAEAELGQKPRQ